MDENQTTNSPEYVRAKKGDREQSFTRETWDMMPGKNHQGWEEIIEEPAELKTLGSASTGPTAEELKVLESLPSLIERYNVLFPDEKIISFPAQTDAEEVKRFEAHILTVESSRKEAEQKDEDEKKALAELNKSSLGKALTKRQEAEQKYKSVFGVENAPKVSIEQLEKAIEDKLASKEEGTGSDAPTPEELLNKISKEA